MTSLWPAQPWDVVSIAGMGQEPSYLIDRCWNTPSVPFQWAPGREDGHLFASCAEVKYRPLASFGRPLR